jgi:hypothetical protein
MGIVKGLAMAEKTNEEKFRDSLKDVEALLGRVETYYDSLAELRESCQLAIDDDRHLKLLMALVLSKGKK